MNYDRLFGILHHHEIKLRKLNFEFEGKLETLNENEIKLILQLKDYVDHFYENGINMYGSCLMLHDTKHEIDNFRRVSSNSTIYSKTPDELTNNSSSSERDLKTSASNASTMSSNNNFYSIEVNSEYASYSGFSSSLPSYLKPESKIKLRLCLYKTLQLRHYLLNL